MTQGVLEKIKTKQRLTPAEGVALFGSFDLLPLGRAADERRKQYHPEPVVTYTVDRNINYTNVCVSGCRFCAFFRSGEHSEAYVISKKDLFNKIQETVDLGGSHILFQGGLHPDLKIDFYEDLLRSVKEKFNIHIHGFSPPEIVHFSRLNDLSLESVLTRLKKAGLDTIPGGGAEILSDRLRRQVSPHKCTAAEWLEVMRQAHQAGMRTTATMMFGYLETIEERVAHLEKIRSLQDETGGFTAFIAWPFQSARTGLSNLKPAGGFDYLKTLAISRLYLDNIPNIQASWVTQGPALAQVALKFGANDLGGTMIEENVVRAARVEFRMTESELRDLVTKAGYRPQKRDCYYNKMSPR